MNIRRKVFSIGTSAALLASLLATVVAPTVSAASTTITGGGAIVPGGSAVAVTIKGSETGLADWPQGGTLTSVVTVFDAGGASKIEFTGTPTVTSSAFVSCTAVLSTVTVTNDTLTISCSGQTDTRLDSFSITGLSVKAISGAVVGAVIATWTGSLDLGKVSATASGKIVPGVAGGVANQPETITLNGGSAPFATTDTANGYSNLAIAGATAESVALTGAAAATATQVVNGVFLLNHEANVPVSQTVMAKRLGTLATVGDTTAVTTCTTPNLVRQGINNQQACWVDLNLGRAGYVPVGATLTYTIATAGAKFSGLPTVYTFGTAPQDFAVGTGVLSFDRKSITYTVTTASSTDFQGFELYWPRIDVDIAAVSGTTVDVNVAVSGGKSVIGNPASIAVIGSTLVGSTSAPTVLIGYNDQPTGMIVLTETAAGTLSDDVNGATNIVRVCLPQYSNVYFVRAPWAVVTAGNLKLNSGGLPVTQVKMTLSSGGECASFLIYSQSTVASTVEIRGGVDAASSAPLASGPGNGPKIDVAVTMTPGPVTAQVLQYNGVVADLTGSTGTNTGAPVIIAMAAFSGSPVVKAVSQPTIVRGGVGQAVGDVTIEETQAGQFQSGEEIELCFLPRSLSLNQDVFFSTDFNHSFGTWSPIAGDPTVATNNLTGLVVSIEGFEHPTFNSVRSNCFEIQIDSAPVSGLGKITVKNLRYDVTADAALGPVLLNVFNESYIDTGDGRLAVPAVAGSNFNQTVSNATVGTPVAASALTAGTALGVTAAGPFSASTKVAALKHYITWQFQGGASLAGKSVQIWVASKSGGIWGPFVRVTSRAADINGNVYYYIRSSSARWVSIRAYYPGDASNAAAWSLARQGRWK